MIPKKIYFDFQTRLSVLPRLVSGVDVRVLLPLGDAAAGGEGLLRGGKTRTDFVQRPAATTTRTLRSTPRPARLRRR